MDSEMIADKLKVSKGLIITFWLKNGFRFQGKIIDCDGVFLEYFDQEKMSMKYIRISEITEMQIK